MSEKKTDVEAGPQVQFGVHIMKLDDGRIHTPVVGEPSMADVQELLTAAYINFTAEFFAKAVQAKLSDQFDEILSKLATSKDVNGDNTPIIVGPGTRNPT